MQGGWGNAPENPNWGGADALLQAPDCKLTQYQQGSQAQKETTPVRQDRSRSRLASGCIGLAP